MCHAIRVQDKTACSVPGWPGTGEEGAAPELHGAWKHAAALRSLLQSSPPPTPAQAAAAAATAAVSAGQPESLLLTTGLHPVSEFFGAAHGTQAIMNLSWLLSTQMSQPVLQVWLTLKRAVCRRRVSFAASCLQFVSAVLHQCQCSALLTLPLSIVPLGPILPILTDHVCAE